MVELSHTASTSLGTKTETRLLSRQLTARSGTGCDLQLPESSDRDHTAGLHGIPFPRALVLSD